MGRKPASEPAREREASPADQAYGAAARFIGKLGTLAWHARRLTDPSRITPRADDPDQWKPLGATYAHAFIAWFDLTHLLTPTVRDAARRAYPPGAPSIKVGNLKAKPTVIEAVADGLGVYFRNVLYQDRRCPLDPDHAKVAEEAKARATARQVTQGKSAEPFGWGEDFDELMKHETHAAVRERLRMKTGADAYVLMTNEWTQQDPEWADAKLAMLRCGSIDFEDLETQLDREARAVLALETHPNAGTIAPPKPTELTDGQRAVWDLLDGHSFTSKEAAQKLGTRDYVVRHHVTALRRKRYEITTLPGGGYYRPDAPPPGAQTQRGRGPA